jgi:hemin uptake protein HemP
MKIIMPLPSSPSCSLPDTRPQNQNREALTQAEATPTAPSSKAANTDLPAGSVSSQRILNGEKAVAIHHNGLIYRLQATRLGKLILTK